MKQTGFFFSHFWYPIAFHSYLFFFTAAAGRGLGKPEQLTIKVFGTQGRPTFPKRARPQRRTSGYEWSPASPAALGSEHPPEPNPWSNYLNRICMGMAIGSDHFVRR